MRRTIGDPYPTCECGHERGRHHRSARGERCGACQCNDYRPRGPKTPGDEAEALHIRKGGETDRCDVHAWSESDWRDRFVAELRVRHGRGGLNVCAACVRRAHAMLRPATG